jgi:hypothetical protein
MGEKCSTHDGTEKRHKIVISKGVKGWDHLRTLGIDGRIILK